MMAKKAKEKGRAETATGETNGVNGAADVDAPTTGAQPGTVIPPKVAPKFRAEAALQPGQPTSLAKDPVAQAAGKALERLRRSWQVIAAIVLVLVVVVLVVTSRADSARARNRLAWQQLREAGDKPAAEKLQDLLERFGGTAAEPFILLRLGDVNLARGDADGANKALATYERVIGEFGANELARTLARSSIETAKKKLSFDPARDAAEKGERVEWAKGAEPAVATPTGLRK